jgi:hypothetical protein
MSVEETTLPGLVRILKRFASAEDLQNCVVEAL